MGRKRAMTIPPITMARKRVMRGSRRDVRASREDSTLSSVWEAISRSIVERVPVSSPTVIMLRIVGGKRWDLLTCRPSEKAPPSRT